MERHAIFFKLKEGALAEYTLRHQNIWKEMTDLLNKAGKHNFSIWNYKNMLFMYYETEDNQKMEEILSHSEIREKWRKEMERYIYIDEKGKKEWPMELVFLHKGIDQSQEN